MNYVVDIGNTKTKLAVFKKNQIKSVKSFDSESFIKNYRQKLKSTSKQNQGILSSVIPLSAAFKKDLRKSFNCLIIDYKIKLPFKNLYKTKKTLGNDRIANVAGAMQLFTGKNILVIDAGSSITYDFVNSKGVYFGGAIAPGVSMRFKSLHHFTKALPYIKTRPSSSKLLGDTTARSIQSGVLNGINHEIWGYISSLKTHYKPLKVIICGGDATFLADRLKNSIFVAQNLTLTGLNSILNHNRADH